jgi:hypothetical protein
VITSLFKKGLSENDVVRLDQTAQGLPLRFEFESLIPNPYQA